MLWNREVRDLVIYVADTIVGTENKKSHLTSSVDKLFVFYENGVEV